MLMPMDEPPPVPDGLPPDEPPDDPPASSTEQYAMYPAQYWLKLMSVLQASAGQHSCMHAWLAVMQVVDRSWGAGPRPDAGGAAEDPDDSPPLLAVGVMSLPTQNWSSQPTSEQHGHWCTGHAIGLGCMQSFKPCWQVSPT